LVQAIRKQAGLKWGFGFMRHPVAIETSDAKHAFGLVVRAALQAMRRP
jgi:hypothetical protein